MNRRNLIGGLWAAGLSRKLLWAQESSSDSPPTNWLPDPQLRDEWMHEAISDSPQQTKAEGALHMTWFPDSIYSLLDTISWRPNPGEPKLASVHVPKGFVSDLASIPRVFYTELRPDGRYAYAAVIHDYLYWTQKITREDADTILKLCMQDFKVPTSSVTLIYSAVRIAGQWAWNQNAQLRRSGEKRILSRFPSDPTTDWSVWKKDPENFR